MPGLGYRYADDPRDHQFRGVVAPSPAAPAPKPRVFPWKAQPSLNQGNTGTCVGHGIKHWMMSAPIVDTPEAEPSAFDLYRRFVLLDEWPDNDAEAAAPDAGLQSGTSVRAGMKWLKAQGYLKEYVRCYSATTIQAAVTTLTPVPVGTYWTEAMSEPTAEGLVRYDGTGIVGGHCYLCHWYDAARGLFLFQNSWGRTWGVDHPTQGSLKGRRGFFYIPGEDVEHLIRDDGEAWAAREVRRRRPHPAAAAAGEGPA
jgi:hypothetical protein